MGLITNLDELAKTKKQLEDKWLDNAKHDAEQLKAIGRKAKDKILKVIK